MAAGPTEARAAGARTLYLECESGISGDMVVAALLDAGASEKVVRDALASLPLDGYDVRITRKSANGIDCCDFDVVLDDAHQNHDHDMAYLYGDLDGACDHDHDHHHHERDHDHVHGHEHDHHDHAHHHEHRNLSDVLAVIDAGGLTPGARDLAHRIFKILADAESKAHGVPADQVHFHEVGTVDSIVDVVAAAVCLDNLGVTQAVVSPLAEGHGRVRTQHGVLPVPVPAVVNIVAANGLTFASRNTEGELVTPTGAAIAAAIRTADALPPAYEVTAVGYGCGKRAYEPVSMVRAMLIEPRPAQPAPAQPAQPAPDALVKLETEVDDCTGEALGNALAKLFSAGAREAHYVPIYMKKNRPAWQIEVLCSQDRVAACERVLFEETTTIGVRRHPVERTALHREEKDVRTPLGPAQVKVVTLPGGATRAYPEHDSVVALAERAGVSYQDGYRAVLAAASQAE